MVGIWIGVEEELPFSTTDEFPVEPPRWGCGAGGGGGSITFSSVMLKTLVTLHGFNNTLHSTSNHIHVTEKKKKTLFKDTLSSFQYFQIGSTNLKIYKYSG